MPRCRPDAATTSLISFSDFRPKFGVLSISASDFCQLADVGDPVVLQAVRRSHGQFEFVDAPQQLVSLAGQNVEIRFGPVRNFHTEMQTDPGQDLLQLV